MCKITNIFAVKFVCKFLQAVAKNVNKHASAGKNLKDDENIIGSSQVVYDRTAQSGNVSSLVPYPP